MFHQCMKGRAPSYQEISLLLARPATARSHFLSTAPLDKTSKHLNHSSRLLLLKGPLLLNLHVPFLFDHETPRSTWMPQSSCTLQECNFRLLFASGPGMPPIVHFR